MLAGHSRAWAPAVAVIRKGQLRGDEDDGAASKRQVHMSVVNKGKEKGRGEEKE